jgi:hypothetical protein
VSLAAELTVTNSLAAVVIPGFSENLGPKTIAMLYFSFRRFIYVAVPILYLQQSIKLSAS